MEDLSHSTKDKTTKYINWISLGSLITLSACFIITSYFEVKALQPEHASNLLLRNIICSGIFILTYAFALRHFLSKVVGLVREKENAEHQAAVKAQFLSTMSHEIRTPMNAVVGLSNILLSEDPRTDQIENLDTLKFSADLLLSLINDILDYSKIEAGKISIEKIDFDLNRVITNIKNALTPKSKEKNIGLNLNIDPSIPKNVIGDPVRLSQILTNLIGNAIKFTDKGAVDIDLKMLKNTEDISTIRFAIKDTGIGIPKDKFDQIFKSFSQAEANTTRKFGGTGLGLSITKRLLELQNSEIQLESEVDKGSTFFFDLMFETAEQKETISKTTKEKEIAFKSFAKESILLVEDNKINIMVAKKFLNKWNLNIDVAENGQIALDKIQANEYSMVLMDLNMPVMDGYTATAEIRKLSAPKYQNLPIIALSASAIADFRYKAFEAGMNAFVTKPFVPEELYGVIEEYLLKSELSV